MSWAAATLQKMFSFNLTWSSTTWSFSKPLLAIHFKKSNYWWRAQLPQLVITARFQLSLDLCFVQLCDQTGRTASSFSNIFYRCLLSKVCTFVIMANRQWSARSFNQQIRLLTVARRFYRGGKLRLTTH